MPPKPRKVLVVLPNNLGDVIMATPVLEGLKARHPSCETHFLVEQGFEDGMRGNPFCDRVRSFDRRWIKDTLCGENWRAGVGVLDGFLREVDAEAFDCVLNLSQQKHVALMATVIGSRLRRGRRFRDAGNHAIADPWSQYLYAVAFARRFNRLHAVDIYRRIASVKDHRGTYTIGLTNHERDEAARFLAARGIVAGCDPVAVLQPGAAYAAKRWPPSHFVELGRLLAARGWKMVITGAGAEAKRAHSIGSALGSACTVSAGSTTFRQSMAIVSHARCCVTGDTALMHAAAALEVGTVALFGPTSPVETGPWGDGHTVLSAPCPERPCFRRECSSMRCMNGVSPNDVFRMVVGEDEGTAKCEVYRTALRPDGDYRLLPRDGCRDSYTSCAGSAMTLAVLERTPADREGVDTGEMETLVAETKDFAAEASAMAGEIDAFLRTGDAARIRAYERRKSGLDRFTRVGAFWSALLNVRLNGLPLLDPVEGAVRSARACRHTAEQLRSMLRRSSLR